MRSNLAYLAASLLIFNSYSQEIGVVRSSESPSKLETSSQNYSTKTTGKPLAGVTVQPALIAEKEARPQQSIGEKIKSIFSVDPDDIEEKEARYKADPGKLIDYLEKEAPIISTYLGEGIKGMREVAEVAGKKLKKGVDNVLPFGFQCDFKTSGSTLEFFIKKEF